MTAAQLSNSPLAQGSNVEDPRPVCNNAVSSTSSGTGGGVNPSIVTNCRAPKGSASESLAQNTDDNGSSVEDPRPVCNPAHDN